MKNKFKILLILLIIVFSQEKIFSQKDKHNHNTKYITNDSSRTNKKFLHTNILLFSGGFGENYALCDLSDKFGFNSNLNLTFNFYSQKGLLLGLDFNYIFGRDLKGEAANLFDNISTSNGQLINMYGEYSQYYLAERGFFAGVKVGYFHKITRNRANKLFSTLSLGFFQHKIHISVDGNNTPQIQGEYAKGYDHLTNGAASKLFLGYAYLPIYSPINFYVGFEFYYSRTRNRRALNFNTRTTETKLRNDCLIGINAGWFIPLYKRDVKKYYYTH